MLTMDGSTLPSVDALFLTSTQGFALELKDLRVQLRFSIFGIEELRHCHEAQNRELARHADEPVDLA